LKDCQNQQESWHRSGKVEKWTLEED